MKKFIISLIFLFNFAYSFNPSDYTGPFCGISPADNSSLFESLPNSHWELYYHDSSEDNYVILSKNFNSQKFTYRTYRFFEKRGKFVRGELSLNTLFLDQYGHLNFFVGSDKSSDNRCSDVNVYYANLYMVNGTYTCESGQEFDFQTKQCSSCPVGQMYNPHTSTCVDRCNPDGGNQFYYDTIQQKCVFLLIIVLIGVPNLCFLEKKTLLGLLQNLAL